MGGFHLDIAGESTGFPDWVGHEVMKSGVKIDG